MSNAWVTLATNDSYSLGALVLAHSLKRAGTAHQLAVLITPGVSNAMRQRLQNVFNVVEEVNVLDSQDSANLALLARPELGITFTKLHCWRLTQFDKCVFLDADTLVLQNADELFEREELSAAPDVGWPDCFNSGVFVYRPSLDTFGKLLDFAVKQGSFDGGDQGLLNLFFSDWAHRDISKHLPFIYNTCSTACYSYLPAFKQFGQNVKILHFIGSMKPWMQSFDSHTGQVYTPSGSEHMAKFLQFWWNIFFQNVHKDLSSEMSTSLASTEISQSLLDSINSGSVLSFVNNTAASTCHRDSEPFTYVDPWDAYPAASPALPQPHEHETVLRAHENVPQIVVIVEAPINHVLAANEQPSSAQIDTASAEGPPPPTAPHAPVTRAEHCHQDHVQVHRESRIRTRSKSPKRIRSPAKPAAPTASGSVSTPPRDEAGIAGALANVSLGSGKSPEQEAYEHQMRRQFWEAGNIDYMGKDSFDNIWARISKTIDNAPAPAAPAAAAASSSAPEAKPTKAAPAKKSATGK